MKTLGERIFFIRQLGMRVYIRLVMIMVLEYSNSLHNDVSVKDGPHIRRWPHTIIVL